MEQRAVIRFLTLKGMNSRQIFSELQSVYGDQALHLPTVFKWHARFRDGRTELGDDPRSGRPQKSDLAEAISVMLEERPFTSCKFLARHFRIAKSTCTKILRKDLGLHKFNLRWVPHTLDETQKRNRVTLCSQLLTIFQQDQQNNFERIITGDESWFYLQYANESAWAESRDQLPVRVSQKINTEKCLISVLWSANGIHALLDVPKGDSYNSRFFCEAVMPSVVSNICSHARRKSLKGFYVHLDNASPHNSYQSNECLLATKARRIPQPAYSPDLAPSDFFLFGFLKQKLRGVHLADREGLKSAITQIFAEIDKDMLVSVFLDWIERIHGVINNGGEYYNR
jgi:histone-lysine N-methyltransferase SETMAR